MRDIKKVIPKNHHVSGVQIQKSLSVDADKYWTVRIQITHDDYESSRYGEYMKDYLVFGISKGGLFVDE
jgi:hypothetical protein